MNWTKSVRELIGGAAIIAVSVCTVCAAQPAVADPGGGAASAGGGARGVAPYSMSRNAPLFATRSGTAVAKAAVVRRSQDAQRGLAVPQTAGDRLATRLAASLDRRPAAAVASVPATPGTTPSGLSVSGDSDVVTFTATSAAGFVAFAVDGVPAGTPVAVDPSSTTATASFASWGYRNGSHTVTAVDCDSTDPASCNVQAPASTTFSLLNQAPVITKPFDGQRITGGFTIDASSADGSGVEFLIDGRRKGFDGAAPYRFAYTGSALSPGRHVLTAIQCSADGTRCAGPTSAQSSIISDSLHPRLVSLSPSPFSPQRNGVKDTATLVFALPDREDVRVSVTNRAGQVVRSARLGSLGASRHSWTWNGRSGSGQLLPSARYLVSIDTDRVVNNVTVRGQVSRPVIVDDRAPRLTSTSAPTLIYPVRDGYRDSFDVHGHLSEPAWLVLTVRNARGHRVFTDASAYRAGRVAVRWNGRVAGGKLVAGTYSWTLAATDTAGNTWRTSSRRITVSSKRLVSHTKTLTRSAASYDFAGSTDSSCATHSKSLSKYKHGVWLLNTCVGESALTALFYRFTVPAAVRYPRLAIEAGGSTQYPPSSLEGGFETADGQSFKITRLGEVPNSKEGWWKLGGMNGTGYVNGRHQALLGIALDSFDAPTDFDLGGVKVIVTYQLLQ